jgi:hypothetical protein
MTRPTIRIETSSPIWRVLAVMMGAGAIAALGFYLNAIGHVNDFATVAVITIGFTISFWAHKRPDRFRIRFGPFGKVAVALRESLDDIRAWTYDRPLRVGALIAVGYGIAVVIAKNLLVLVIRSLYSWYLAVAVGLAIGAVVAAPQMFAALVKRIAGPQDEVSSQAEEEQGPER